MWKVKTLIIGFATGIISGLIGIASRSAAQSVHILLTYALNSQEAVAMLSDYFHFEKPSKKNITLHALLNEFEVP